jgi:fumigallin biosynthesis monooxygenase-like protein
MRGRMTADIDGDFVVFLIGMRINRPWKLHKWVPVFRAMVPMLRTLHTRKELGLLATHTWVGPHGPMLVQYWRTVEQLEAFARDATLPHHPAWRRFNRQVGFDGDVGIWHETFQVRAGEYETVYGNMPRFGLAAAGAHVPVAAKGDRAAERRAAGRAAAGGGAAPTA